MRLRLAVCTVALAFVVGIAWSVYVPATRAQSAAAAATPEQIAQGKYIVTSVGMCGDCHGADLHGGPLQFGPLGQLPPGVKFAKKSSNLVRYVQRHSAAELASFLQTGKSGDGDTADPPMPQYRMNASDAQAVAAYIASLPQ